MTTWAIIPVKPLHKSKSRLSGVLSKEERFELMREMFLHVLATLRAVSTIDEIMVVSKEPSIASLAPDATIYRRENPSNLNAAVRGAAAHAWERGADTIVILPADLAILESEDVSDLIATRGSVVICPDNKFDGTNGLLLRQLPHFTFRYGEESFQKHLGEAARHEAIAQVMYADSIEFDLDTPADLQQYRRATLQPT